MSRTLWVCLLLAIDWPLAADEPPGGGKSPP